MRKSFWLMMAGLALLIFNAGVARAVIITFEEGVGQDGTAINTQYTGITFTGASSGLPWLYADVTTGYYNASSWPSGLSWGTGDYWIDGLAAAWTGESGPDGKIAFNNADATFFQINYSSYSRFYLEAYDSGGNLLASTSGPANLRYLDNNPNGPGTLEVNAPSGDDIAYVKVHDTGNFWIVDNVVTDATGISGGSITPEPATIIIWSLLGGLGLVFAWRRSRKAV